MADFAALRTRMVDGQIRPNEVTDRRIIEAMLSVPREDFVLPAQRELAYLDDNLPVGGAGRRVLIQPMVLARLIQAAGVTAADKVLEVGTATGYGAAVLALLARSVVALEVDPVLATAARAALAGRANVSVAEEALAGGFAAAAPYDVILLNGAVETFPVELGRQLAEGGRLLLVEGRGNAACAMIYRKSGGELSAQALFNAAVPVLPGFERVPAFAF